MAKSIVPLPLEEALRRVKLIVPMLRSDVQTAVVTFAILEAINDTVPQGLSNFSSEFAETYGYSQNALSLKVALDLARVFDLSMSNAHPPEQQDKASIPVLAALMTRKDVQGELLKGAHAWLPSGEYVGSRKPLHDPSIRSILDAIEAPDREADVKSCEAAIEAFLKMAEKLFIVGSDEQVALNRIRDFRNKRLAHSLFNKAPDELPKYSDLKFLLEFAKIATKHATFADNGHNVDLEDLEKRHRLNADGYAACLLDGLRRASTPK